MLKKFFILAAISFFAALSFSMTASYLIQTREAHLSANGKLSILLDDVGVLISDNDEQIKSIRADLDESYLEKTRVFAEMLRQNPDLKDDYDSLCYIRDTMNVDELHIIDDDGILRYGTVIDYYGYDMASAAQSGEFMQIISNPSIELVQDPQPNGADGKLFQYVGVARKDADGFVQIGLQPARLEEAMEQAAPENILNQIKIDNTMRILLLSNGTVVGDSRNKLAGQTISGISEGSGNVTLDSSGYYVARNTGNYLAVAFIGDSDMYGTRNTMLIVFLIANALILFFLILVVGLWMVKNIIRPLGNVSEDLEIIAGGNLERKVNARKTPEFETLSDSINAMVDSIKKTLRDADGMTETLKAVIDRVESNATSIDMSTRELFRESRNLTDGAASQSQAAQTMSELLSSIHTSSLDNVKYASNASEASRVALENADIGSRKMVDMVSAVNAIDGASQDISKVIKSIDDIAFQTNILALNAAVEAARAGQHGKGFAVVADEVRNLAAKSAQAAKQTEELIGTSIQRAGTGVQIAGETAGTITEIVENIRKSASLMEGIVTSSKEQAAAVGRLNDNMASIQKSVDVTLLSAQNITGESEKLQSNSRDMSEVIGRIKSSQEDAQTTQSGAAPAQTGFSMLP